MVAGEMSAAIPIGAGGSRVVEELAEPRHASLQQLKAYWLAKKGAALAPPRSAIRPEEIVALLPNLALVDVVGDLPRFRVRLFGTALAAAYGGDITGKFVDEVDFGRVGGDVIQHMTTVVRECRPVAVRISLTKSEDRRHIDYERIWLPLSQDGIRVTMLLGGVAVERVYASVTPPPLA
jgi:hypothetical protein